MPTEIEWCDEVWNVVTGCSPVSEGCAHCYAKRMANRLKGRFGYPEDEPFRVTFHPDRLNQPLKWKKPKRIFVCSMGDLFHDDVKDEWIYRVIHQAFITEHTFIILTKRPHRMRLFFETHEIWPNLWLGISAENQQTADERIPILLQIPAAKRFVSLEPMLGPVDLRPKEWLGEERTIDCGGCSATPVRGQPYCPGHDGGGIDWTIIGGLSLPGGKAQAPDPQWIDDIVEQCDSAGVALFIKDNALYHKVRQEFPV